MQALTDQLRMLQEEHDQETLGEAAQEMREPDDLKEDINNFLWCHLPAKTTLRDGEDLACALYSIIAMLYAGKTLKQIAENK